MEGSEDPGDARAMSPRRSGPEVEEMSQEMRRAWHQLVPFIPHCRCCYCGTELMLTWGWWTEKRRRCKTG